MALRYIDLDGHEKLAIAGFLFTCIIPLIFWLLPGLATVGWIG